MEKMKKQKDVIKSRCDSKVLFEETPKLSKTVRAKTVREQEQKGTETEDVDQRQNKTTYQRPERKKKRGEKGGGKKDDDENERERMPSTDEKSPYLIFFFAAGSCHACPFLFSINPHSGFTSGQPLLPWR